MSAKSQKRRKRDRVGTPEAGVQADENWLKSDITAGMLLVRGSGVQVGPAHASYRLEDDIVIHFVHPIQKEPLLH